MRKSRMPLLIIVAVGMLAGSTVGVVALSDDDAEAPGSSELVTKELAPGVERVVRDGAGRRFVFDEENPKRPEFDAITIAPDGTVLILAHRDDRRRDGTDPVRARLWAVGKPGGPAVDIPSAFADMAASPDGTLWVAGEGRYLARFEDGAWRVVRPQRGLAELLALSVGGDGTVWGAWEGEAAMSEQPGVIARFEDGRWVDVIGHEWARHGGRTRAFKMAAASDGTIWAGLGPGASLAHYDGEGWRLVWPLGEGVDHAVYALAVTRDDTLWALLQTYEPPGTHLARLDTDGWTVYSEADGIPQWAPLPPLADYIRDLARGKELRPPCDEDRALCMEVAPDGTVWLIHQEGGLVAFDGDSSERYLDDLLVRDLAIDTDGSVWVFGNDGKPKTADIYLVRPADTDDE